MKAVTNVDFAAVVLGAAKPAKPFRPVARYDPDGDCLEVFLANDPFYAQRLDDLVTVYRSEKTDQVVGSLVKGVRKLCREMKEKCPGFSIEIEAEKVKVEHIFLIAQWNSKSAGKPLVRKMYRELLEKAEDAHMEASGVRC
jgi:hypothetical protein